MKTPSLILFAMLAGCGAESMPQQPDLDAFPSRPTDLADLVASSADLATSYRDAAGFDSGAVCSATAPHVVACGGLTCDATTQVCCGNSVSGKCVGIGKSCGQGVLWKLSCDDASDCAVGQVCCLVPNPLGGADTQWVSQCQPPLALPQHACGGNAGGIAYSQLCTCATECAPSDPARSCDTLLQSPFHSCEPS